MFLSESSLWETTDIILTCDTSVNLQKSYLDLYSTYVTYVTHGAQLCVAEHDEENKSISILLISLIRLIDL